ncbi:MAG: ribonuclease P protein component [Gemmatimonadetes bacterium]|nr:ribonuclease P protein component [Gemmatimonadota bacterium]
MGQLPRERRIRTRKEIGALLGSDRVRGSELELFSRPAVGGRSRGTCITPKFGRTSVARNRLRRRLKALIAEVLFERGEARDWLVRIRPAAYERSYQELRAELVGLADRLERRPPQRSSESRE